MESELSGTILNNQHQKSTILHFNHGVKTAIGLFVHIVFLIYTLRSV